VDPLEVVLDERCIAAFDGRVLELFGVYTDRFHATFLRVSLAAPDKRGVRRVTLEQPGTIATLSLDDAAFARIQPMLDALRSAGVAVDG
jgi:hypothetical protein